MPVFNTRPKSTNPTESPPSTATPITNTLTTAGVELVPENLNRKFVSITNPLSVTAYIDFDDAVSDSDYAMAVYPGDYVELPVLHYGTDAIFAVLASGTGSLLVREYA